MKSERSAVKVFAACILLIMIGSGAGAANAARQHAGDAPGVLTYNAQLTNDAGQPVADGVYAFTFTLYESETGGAALWSETQPAVSVRAGDLYARLGSVSPLPEAIEQSEALWLEISLRAPGESDFTLLTPRQPVSAAPASATAVAACPHDHVGETWSGSRGWSNSMLKISNAANGPTIWGVNTNGGNAIRGDGYGTAAIGVYGEGDSGPGVAGRSSTGKGIEASSIDGYGLTAHSDNSSSIYVDGAGIHALKIGSSGGAAVYIDTSGGSGIYVNSAFADGITIQSAGNNGVNIQSAGDNGVNVNSGAIGGACYRCGTAFKVLNTGEVQSAVGFKTPSHDFAEMIALSGEAESYEPGDVLVISSSQDRAVERSTTPYAAAVLGVYSTSPGFVGGMPPDSDPAELAPVAVMGIVPCKVSTENGAIRRGDLLTTSATPGHAMRADQPPPGTVLGKAMQPLAADQPTGVILILVTLQ